MTLDPNNRIKEYINAYRADNRPFALLLDGPWGSGKTFLVRNSMRGSTTHIHISLNGTKDLSDVLERLYYEAYPVLADKTIRALGSLAKTIAGAFRIKSELSKEDLLALDKFDTLIFDDFERSNIKPDILMGFINNFVETDPKRVIIIANCQEITSNKRFKQIKEKVVGRTLLVKPDFESFFEESCKYHSSEYESFLVQNKLSLLSALQHISMNNLRALGYCLDEFKETYNFLRGRDVPDDAIIGPFYQFIVLTYFFRIGKIGETDLSEAGDDSLARTMRRMSDGYTPSFLDKINEKLNDIDILEQHLDNDYLKTYIVEGLHSTEYLERTAGDLLGRSDASLNPDWRNLWYLIHQSDAVIRDSYKSFLQKFQRRAYDDAGVIIHAFGLLYTLRDAGLNRWTDQKILEESISYVDDLFRRDALPILERDFISSFRHGAAHGLGFSNLENPKMQAAMQYYRDMSGKLKWENIQKELRMTFSQDEFNVTNFKDIILEGHRADNLFGTPALHEIDAKQFVRSIMKETDERRYSILLALRSRYSSSPYPEVRRIEAPWLRKIAIQILERAQKSSKLQEFKLRELVRMTLNEFIVTSHPIAPPPS